MVWAVLTAYKTRDKQGNLKKKIIQRNEDIRVCCLKLESRGGTNSYLFIFTGQNVFPPKKKKQKTKQPSNAKSAMVSHAKGIQNQPPMNRKSICKWWGQPWRTSSWSSENTNSDPFELLICIFRQWALKMLLLDKKVCCTIFHRKLLLKNAKDLPPFKKCY